MNGDLARTVTGGSRGRVGRPAKIITMIIDMDGTIA